MADIAFLLLTFFLVTTQIQNDRGLIMVLPSLFTKNLPQEISSRNLFKIQINSSDKYLVEDIPRTDLSGIREEIKLFILNYGKIAGLSDNPENAIVSLKTDRGTSYSTYIKALDEIQGAYYEIYSRRAGISADQFRSLDLSDAKNKLIYEKARLGIPMNISIAEPTRID